MSAPRIGYQGEPGSNSHTACREDFPAHDPIPYPAFEDVFEAVRTGECALALIPMENSIAGRVSDVHYLLPSSGLRIVGERFRPIHFHLMANPGVRLEDLRTVASMPIALGQCRRTLRRLGLAAEPTSDTASAARALADKPDPTRAAVAPALAAELYGLSILLRDIEDEANNTTRFVVMTNAGEAAVAPPPPPPCVTSFVFRVRNLPAALYKALGGFATNGVNMTKLESYMENGVFQATFFHAEVDGRPTDPPLARALEELAFFSDHVEILGVFAADAFRRIGQGG